MEAVDQIIRATGWAILHSLWQGAIIYSLLYLVAQQFFAHKAVIRYNLATFAGLLLLCSFMFTFAEYFQWPAGNQHSAPSIYHRALPGLVPAFVPLTSLRYIELVFPWLVLSYSIGIIFQTLLFVQGYKKVQKLKKAVHQTIPQEWFLKLENLRVNLSIKRKISYFLSDQVQVPMVIGFLKPVILFPAMLATQLDMKQIEAIMIHELSHIKRNDYLFNLLRTLTETILFFNPFVWLIGKMMATERENACDDQVVKLTQTPLTYAKALLQLELMCQNQKPVLVLAATGEEQHLYQRIKRITNMKTDQINTPQKLFALGLTFATLISLAWVNPANQEKSRTTKRSQVTIRTAEKYGKSVQPKQTILCCDTIPMPPAPVSASTQKVAAPPIPPIPPIAVPIPLEVNIPIPPLPPLPPLPANQIAIDQVINLSTEIGSAIATAEHQVKQNEKEMEKIQQQMAVFGEKLKQHFNSPEQKAKWEKYGEELKAAFNSPQYQTKLKKFQKEIQAHYDIPGQYEHIEKKTTEETMERLKKRNN